MSDENDEAWIRFLWEYSGKGLKPDGSHRTPTAVERKRIVRQLRNLRRAKHNVGSTAKATSNGHAKGMQFIDTLFHNAEAARAGKLDWLKKVPPEQRYARMPKPWKGKAGRDQHKENAKASDLAKRARQLHSEDPELTHLQIAERLGIVGKPETLKRRIRRYLGGPDIPNS